MALSTFLNLQHRFNRLLHWEYWPQIITYFFIYPVYGWYAIRAKNFFFVTLTNPNIENGGLAMESKFKIYKNLPKNTYPLTLKVCPKNENIFAKMKLSGLNFPVICKPDVGGKGAGVEIIYNNDELKRYCSNAPSDFLIQSHIKYQNEVGIFYCRYPQADKGFISGIVIKKKVTIVGDGISTVHQLISKSSRYFSLQKQLFKQFEMELGNILPAGEEFILSSIGNHARGSEFVDATHLVNEQLLDLFDRLAKHNNLLYFGRFDVLYHNWESLCLGEQFSIIEVNGCGSEPVHIYDTKYSIFKAWNIICKHWRIAYEIAMQQPQVGKLKFSEGFEILRKESALKREIYKTSS